MGAGPAGQVGVLDQRGPDAGVPVGRDAHADARGADQHRLVGPAIPHALDRGMREVRIVHRHLALGTHVFHCVAALLEQRLHAILQLHAAMIRADYEFHARFPRPWGSGESARFLDVQDHVRDTAVQQVPRLPVEFQRATDGIRHARRAAPGAQAGDQMNAVAGLGGQPTGLLDVGLRHAHHDIGFLDQFPGQRAAAMLG